MAEIEDNIASGIRSIDKLGISSTRDSLTIIYSVKDASYIVKRLLLK